MRLPDDTRQDKDVQTALFQATYSNKAGEGGTTTEEDYSDEHATNFDELADILSGTRHSPDMTNPETSSLGYDQGDFETQRLSQLEYGKYDDSRKEQHRFEARMRDARLLGERLEFTDVEAMTMFAIIDELHGSDEGLNFGSYSVEDALVACASLALDTHARHYERRAILREDFDEVMDEQEVSSDELRSLRQSIRSRTPL